MNTTEIKDVLFKGMEEDTEPTEYSPVVDVIEAENMVGRILVAESNMERINQFLEYVKNRAQELIKKEESRIARAKESLEPFVKARIDENLKFDKNAKKSLSLTLGTVGFKKNPDRLEIEDMEGAVRYAESHGIPIKVVKSVGKTALKDHVKQTGQVDESFKYIEGEEHFYVKTGT